MNPVIVLDEVDKLGADFRGDPSSALLEVLDPAQNHTFRDHYLEVDLDLSRVLFIATANVVDTIPGPLLDRMEVIRLDGYTETEKVSIARHHLVRRQLGAGRPARRTRWRSPTTPCVPSWPTTPARPVCAILERELGRLLRKVATKLASGEREAPVVVDDGRRARLAGPAPLLLRGGRPHQRARRGDRPGRHRRRWRRPVRRGERLRRPRGARPSPVQLGDVMKESAEIALSYVRSHAEELGIDPAAFTGKRFHLHVPAGAVPKDGPSAGVTMTTALVSLLRDVPGAVGGRHDRRGHAAGPGAAHRRRQAEGARRPPGRAHRGRAARAQRAGPRGRARGGPRAS